MHQEPDIIVRLEQMNKRYIRKPECKQTLTDAVKEIKHLRKRIQDLYDVQCTPTRSGFSPTYRG
jgi:hypothetical protein